MLHFYWEWVPLMLSTEDTHNRCRICPKLDDAGKLKQEMILVWYVLDGVPGKSLTGDLY